MVPREMKRKKRFAPDPVAPVSFEGRRYEAINFGKARGLGQNGGYVAAIDEASGRELWVQRVYRIRYDRRLEGDKQDVFIIGLMVLPTARAILIENERGARYRLDLRTRQVRPDECLRATVRHLALLLRPLRSHSLERLQWRRKSRTQKFFQSATGSRLR